MLEPRYKMAEHMLCARKECSKMIMPDENVLPGEEYSYIGLGHKQIAGMYIGYRTACQNSTLNTIQNNSDARNDQVE